MTETLRLSWQDEDGGTYEERQSLRSDLAAAQGGPVPGRLNAKFEAT